MIGFSTARSESTVALRGVVSETNTECAHQMLLHFYRERAVAPAGKLRIERGDKRVGRNADGGGLRIEQAVIVDVRSVHLVLPAIPRNEIERGKRVLRLVEVVGLK